jgi:hypothetical protein
MKYSPRLVCHRSWALVSIMSGHAVIQTLVPLLLYVAMAIMAIGLDRYSLKWFSRPFNLSLSIFSAFIIATEARV